MTSKMKTQTMVRERNNENPKFLILCKLLKILLTVLPSESEMTSTQGGYDSPTCLTQSMGSNRITDSLDLLPLLSFLKATGSPRPDSALSL